MNHKKALVFFSAGLGDAVLLIPLIRSLKERGYYVTGLFNSIHPCEDIFSRVHLIDEIIVCKTRSQQLLFTLTHLSDFDQAFINYFATNRANLLTACLVSARVFVNRKINSIIEKIFSSRITYSKPDKSLHDAEQNLGLTGKQQPKILLQDFHIDLNSQKREGLPHSFVIVQISAGNNKINYKNWPVKHWIEFLKLLRNNYPEKKLVLLGDEHEINLAEQIQDELKDQVISLIGKTSIPEVMNVIARSEFYIGLDGGLMHLAVALKKPTFTLWGPSSTELYGYEKFNRQIHKCIHLDLSCRPCSAWINANQTRVSSPASCPDNACMQQLLPNAVFDHFRQYLTSLPSHAG